MTDKQVSIKLTAAFVGLVRQDAAVLHRSVGAQIEYWAKIGRAVENAPGVGMEQIRDVLNGTFRLDGLTAAEQSRAIASLSAVFDAPDDATLVHYAALGDAPEAVGTDGKGGVTRRYPPSRGRTEPGAPDDADLSDEPVVQPQNHVRRAR